MEITRTFDILERLDNMFIKDDILAGKQDGEWIKYSTKEYIENVNFVSYGMLALGLKKGDKVATISNNRPEWNFIDMGLSQTGLVHVPIYPTISIQDYRYILNHAEPKLVIVSDKILYAKLKPLADEISSIQEIYSLNYVDEAKNWTEFYELGKKNVEKYKDELLNIKKSIPPEEMVTLIYTSGTTGNPKGVMLSHVNLVSNSIETSKAHPYGPESKTLSFLPLSHVYERMMNYHFQYKGISIYYAENMGTIVDNVKEIKPDIFNSVPRLLEKVYDGIIAKGKDLTYLKKQIFFWAVNLGHKFTLKNKHRFWYRLRLQLADKLIFSKWREALGGNIKLIVSGGAALQPRLARIFWAANIRILEGYGLTETSPVIAVNNLNHNGVKFGTVGPIIEGIDVKISEDGEILCKGPNIMVGYYKSPELTSEVIDKNGWFHTGDIGVIEDDRFLKITDRKKEIFKLNSGKYIAPQVIENKLKESFFIEQAMVIGENEKFASALISPNFSFLHDWCARYKIHYRDNKTLITIPQVISRYQKEVNTINSQLGAYEQIKRFRLVHEEWSPQTGELSPTLKLKRNIINDRYRILVKDIYAPQKKTKGIIPKIKNGIKNGVNGFKKNIKISKD